MTFPHTTFFTRAELIKIGVTDDEIKRACRRGAIVAVARGAYADAGAYADMSTEQRHVLCARGVAASCSAAVISHQSAAAVHGLAMWNADFSRVHLSVADPHHGRRSARLHVHGNSSGGVTKVGGVAVTSVTRTAVDLARSLSFEAAVCVVDSALASGLTTVGKLEGALATSKGMAGAGAARRVIAFADGRSESVGESRSRVYLQRYDFPVPELQVTLRHPYTMKVMRPDLLFDGVILEFDGRRKYTSSEVLFDEKKREDELTSLGWVVVRWTWEDLASDAGAIKLRRGFERAAGLPPPIAIRL